MEDSIRKTVVRNVAEESCFTISELDLVYRLFKVNTHMLHTYSYCPKV